MKLYVLITSSFFKHSIVKDVSNLWYFSRGMHNWYLLLDSNHSFLIYILLNALHMQRFDSQILWLKRLINQTGEGVCMISLNNISWYLVQVSYCVKDRFYRGNIVHQPSIMTISKGFVTADIRIAILLLSWNLSSILIVVTVSQINLTPKTLIIVLTIAHISYSSLVLLYYLIQVRSKINHHPSHSVYYWG